MIGKQGSKHPEVKAWAAWVEKRIGRLGLAFLDLFFPRPCAACREIWLPYDQGAWCEDCLAKLPWIQSPLCPGCGRPFPKSPTSGDHLCGECLLGSFPFHVARSAVNHSGIVRDRINQLKFGGQLHWARPLAELLSMTLSRESLPRFDFIVPVPLHTKRLRQRGFNQAGLIAGNLAQGLKLPVRFDLLIRRHSTEPQTRLNREERLRNVRGAFDVASPAPLRGRTLLLVDDVFTTGTTLGECSKTLKRAGASRVYAVTVTRALPEWKPVYRAERSSASFHME